MKKILIVFALLLLIASVVGYQGYKAIWDNNINDSKKELYLYIHNNTTFNNLLDSLQKDDIVKSIKTFTWTSTLMKFNDQSIKPGKYLIKSPMSNRELIQKLRTGRQEPIDVIIGNHRTIESVIGTLSRNFEFDSLALSNHLFSEIENLGFDKENIISLFIPDTYQLFWNVTPSQFLDRIKGEYDKYWADRKEQAKSLGMTQQEVSTLASIVEKESNFNPEKPRIAGVYINRLKRGILLQADPTVVFANQDFSIRRVLNKHLAFKSPYNTYLNVGLPPGPICLPSKSSIDAVLNYEKHKYLYFCAQIGYDGKHDFAKNLVQHNKNARKYQRWLSKEGIRK